MAAAAGRFPEDAGLRARERCVVALALVTGLAASPAALHAGRRDAVNRDPLSALRGLTPVPRVIQPVDQIALPVDRGFDMFDASQVVRSAVGRPAYNVPASIDSFVAYTGLLPRRYSLLLDRLSSLGPARWVAFRRFAVTHAALTPPLTESDRAEAGAAVAGAAEVGRGANGVLLFALPHTPWARFATDVRSAGSEEEAIQLTARLAAQADPAVVLEGPVPPHLSGGRLVSLERGVDRLRLLAEAPGEGLLVVADAWWPGWVAELDGRSVPLLRADAIFRAVRWPPGRHVLTMVYRPREVYAGLWLSAAGRLLLAATLATGLRDCRAAARRATTR